MNLTTRTLRVLSLFAALALCAHVANAAPTYIAGHISNVTLAEDTVMLMVDSGLPDNCAGTSWGWLRIPATSKPIASFVLSLWMRGDLDSTGVTVYTDGLVNGYCRVIQIDPAE